MVNVALAGLGTVGAGVVRLMQKNADLVAARAGQKITITAVSARDKNRKRPCDVSGMIWVDDPRKFADMPDIDVIVELIGGADGVARELAELSLKRGKHYVTANKALLATHGATLASLAEAAKVQLQFEASVAGGIPILKTLREGMVGNRIASVRGILNGTSNYILTLMQAEALSFADALRQAQDKGYAEADPSADIDGHDAAYKLAILTALAFGVEPDFTSIKVEGIRGIEGIDIKLALELGYRIKLLGLARQRDDGIEQRVSPCLVPLESPLAQVEGAQNAVMLNGDFVGDLMLQGAGAGAEPTASAVVADIVDVVCGARNPAFGVDRPKMTRLKSARDAAAQHYLRLQVMDKPGVVADIAAILRDEAISIESFIQHGKSANESVPVVITTHAADAGAMRRAVDAIKKLTLVAAPPRLLRIED